MNKEVDITLHRNPDNGVSTIGRLIIGSFECWTLEDPHHSIKIYGKTRIPAARYEIILRTFGDKHDKYKERFPFHKGMLWLQDVPDYEDILIHTGNHAGDTKGCILTGSHKVNDDWVDDSTNAYLALYGYCLCLFDLGCQVFINIMDEKIN
jgi:hypothetical protein